MTGKPWLFVPFVLAAAALSGAGCGSGDSPSPRVEAQRAARSAEGLAPEAAAKIDASQAAIRALGARGPESIPQLQQTLKDESPVVRVAAALAYGQAVQVGGQTVVPAEKIRPLAEAVRTDPSPDVRAAAVTALGHARAMDEMQTLIDALMDPEPMVRARANAAVARITGRRYETYVNGTPEQRKAAVAAIKQMWAADEKGTRAYYANKQRAQAAPKAAAKTATKAAQ